MNSKPPTMAVLEKVDELYRKGGCAVYLPEGVPYNGRWNQEDHQCHGCQLRVDAEGQAKAPNYFNGSGTQHKPGHQAGGCAMLDECFAARAWLMIPRPFSRNMIAMRTREKTRTYR